MCWWLHWRDVKVWKCEWPSCIMIWWSCSVLGMGEKWGKDRKKPQSLEEPYFRSIKEDWVKDDQDFFDIYSGMCLSRGDKFRKCCASRKQESPRALLWHSRLRTWHCHCSSLGCCCGTGSSPGPGTSSCHGWDQKLKALNCLLSNYNYIWELVIWSV